ncbi:MAG TPA: hypothetical protein VMR51_01830 [Patescibacteria group bacterium]|nr:hypothetical protein [Patescibacteria group bacterium]
MREKINEKVSVVTVFSAKRRAAAPYVVSWQNKEYKVGEIGYHHTIKDGEVLHHIYELADKESTLWMRLNFDTSTMQWTLEAVSDGLAS